MLLLMHCKCVKGKRKKAFKQAAQIPDFLVSL